MGVSCIEHSKVTAMVDQVWEEVKELDISGSKDPFIAVTCFENFLRNGLKRYLISTATDVFTAKTLQTANNLGQLGKAIKKPKKKTKIVVSNDNIVDEVSGDLEATEITYKALKRRFSKEDISKIEAKAADIKKRTLEMRSIEFASNLDPRQYPKVNDI